MEKEIDRLTKKLFKEKDESKRDAIKKQLIILKSKKTVSK